MENFIKQLEIKNFKSIKHLSLDCKRVNVFIGKPNVGKSNILEALGLLGWWNLNPEWYDSDLGKKFFEKKVRYETLNNLFYDGIGAGEMKINSNLKNVMLWTRFSSNKYSFTSESNRNAINLKLELTEKGIIKSTNEECFYEGFIVTKKYDYSYFSEYNRSDPTYLFFNGENLFGVLDSNPELRKDIASKIGSYDLEFVLSKTDNTFVIQKRSDGYVYQYPYSSIADTFQRFIFYLAAIESNSNSVLVFEEPEVHSFPPYVKELAERMVLKDDNQYFVSTHSPYLLQTFIDSLDDSQLNVYLTYYKDYQTHVKALSSEELRDIQDFGYDVFFNLRKFEPNV